MSISLKSIANKANKHKEVLKDLEAQNKEYWLSSLYTLLECPKIIAEHFVSCAQKGLYECRISRGWLYSEIKERNNSFDLGIESDEFVLLYLFCLKNIIETYEEKYDILCYGVFYHNSKEYITPELKVNWKDSETKDKSKTKNDNTNSGMPYKTMSISCVVLAVASLVGTAVFYNLGNILLSGLSAILVPVFLIGDIGFMFYDYFGDNEPEFHSDKKTNDDISKFDGIYEAILTVTKEQELKEVYTEVVDILGYNINNIKPRVVNF